MASVKYCECGVRRTEAYVGMNCEFCGGFIVDIRTRPADIIDVPLGRKDDKGKMRYSLMVEGMPKGIAKIVEVLEHGAIKYDIHNWQKVENGLERYKEAFYRHVMNMDGGLFSKDKDSGLLHLAHIACNALFLLELMEDVTSKTYQIKVTGVKQQYEKCGCGIYPTHFMVKNNVIICQNCNEALVVNED